MQNLLILLKLVLTAVLVWVESGPFARRLFDQVKSLFKINDWRRSDSFSMQIGVKSQIINVSVKIALLVKCVLFVFTIPVLRSSTTFVFNVYLFLNRRQNKRISSWIWSSLFLFLKVNHSNLWISFRFLFFKRRKVLSGRFSCCFHISLPLFCLF